MKLLIVVAVFAILLTSLGCHQTIPMVVTPANLTAGVARAGDTLQWTTLSTDGPGYTVTFVGDFPCKPPRTNPFHVNAGEKVDCIVMAPAGSNDESIDFTYHTTLDPLHSTSAAAADDSGPGAHEISRSGMLGGGLTKIPYGVVPCKTCAQDSPNPEGAAFAANSKAGEDDPGGIQIEITCTNNVATAPPITIGADGSQFVWWHAGGRNWTTHLYDNNVCSKGQDFNKSSSHCLISKGATAGPHKYSITRDNCGNGEGQLTVTTSLVLTPQPVQ